MIIYPSQLFTDLANPAIIHRFSKAQQFITEFIALAKCERLVMYNFITQSALISRVISPTLDILDLYPGLDGHSWWVGSAAKYSFCQQFRVPLLHTWAGP